MNRNLIDDIISKNDFNYDIKFNTTIDSIEPTIVRYNLDSNGNRTTIHEAVWMTKIKNDIVENIKLTYDKDGNVVKKVQRIDTGYLITKYINGRICHQTYVNNNGDYHRNENDGPADIFIGKYIRIERWCVNGKNHRSGDKPAYIEYEDGQIIKQTWYTNDKLNRDNGPAIITYHDNGKVAYMLYIHNDNIYNDFGPVEIHYDTEGNVIFERWNLSDGIRKDHIINIKYDPSTNTKKVMKKYNTNKTCYYVVEHFTNDLMTKRQYV